MGVIVVLFVIALVAWMIFTQVAARQQVTVSCRLGAAEAREIVAGSFGVAWSQVGGRGTDNFRPRMRFRPPVISVDYRPASPGACEVHIWCSAFATKCGAMNHAQLVWRKKLSLARRLAGGAAPGAPGAVGVAGDAISFHPDGQQAAPAQPGTRTSVSGLDG
jgi:hypothetical protein